MKVREIASKDPEDEPNELSADFQIRCESCGELIGYHTPGDDPGYTFCMRCHAEYDDASPWVVDLDEEG